jgi:hypothetical protein
VIGVFRDAAGALGTGSGPALWGGSTWISDDANIAIGATGVTWEVVSDQWPGGGPGVQLRIFGTPTASFTRIHVGMEARGLVTTSWNPATVTTSAEVMLVAGATTNFSNLSITIQRVGSGGNLQGGDSGSTAITPTGTPQRFSTSRTLGVTSPRPANSISFGLTNGAAVDMTIALRWPLTENRLFATNPVLPLTTGGNATTGSDLVTSILSSLAPTNVWTIVASGSTRYAAAGIPEQALFNIDDGTDANRFRMRIAAGTTNVVMGNVIAGTPTDATTLGTITASTDYRVGMTWDGTTLIGNLNGGSNQTLAGSPGALNTARFGNNAAGDAPLIGEFAYLDFYPFATPAGQLPALVSAIPV